MLPVKPLDANVVYKGPTEVIGDLECTRVELGHIKVQFRLSDEEKAWIEAGALVQLDLYTEPIPPISLNVAEPFCPECMVEMEMKHVAHISRFFCPECGIGA